VRAEQASMEVIDAEYGSRLKTAVRGLHLCLTLETMWASTQIIPSTAGAEQVQLGRGLRLLQLC